MADQRPAPFLIADSLALDFINTIAKPKAVQFEWLNAGNDLLNWMVAADLATEAEITALRHPSLSKQLSQAAETIRAFREEFRAFVHQASESGTVPADHPMIARLNTLLSQGAQTLHLSPTPEGGFSVESKHSLQTVDDLLPRIAAACAELIAEADFAHVRNCEGPECSLYFRDVSKNRKRRWCSMEVCGNRAKAAAYRARSERT